MAWFWASLGTGGRPSQVVLGLSPEAGALFAVRHFSAAASATGHSRMATLLSPKAGRPPTVHIQPGETVLVVDCGGGSVSGGVFRAAEDGTSLHQVLPAAGGPRGDLAVDLGFEILLCEVFGAAFIKEYQAAFPVTWLELMGAFASRKAALNPLLLSSLNLTLPASFAAAYAKGRKGGVALAVRRYRDPDVGYTDGGVLRLGPAAIQRLFDPTITGILQFIEKLLASLPTTAREGLRSIYLLGGFAQSPILQHALNKAFNHRLQVVIPSEPGFASAKGGVFFARNPAAIASRASHLTFGMGVLHPFLAGVHPASKRLVKGGSEWCADVFDPLVRLGDALRSGHTSVRRYCPATASQREILLQIYTSEAPAPPAFVTDSGVVKAAQIRIRLERSQPDPSDSGSESPKSREVEVRLVFGETELSASAKELSTGRVFVCELSFR